jgi:D-alanyl-lipoteichoic acid acyltransferase DltB (MBOAT superfamily)
MSFITISFLFFFIVIFFSYWLIKNKSLQNILLLASSYIFCGWVHPWFAVPLAVTTGTDYLLSQAMIRYESKKKLWLGISIGINLSLLVFFKYLNFFASNLTNLLNRLHIPVEPIVLNLLIPIGISFYTLRKLGYILDVYRQTAQPTKDFVSYALYVGFFPQLVAGPIDQNRTLLPQILKPRKWSWHYFHSAWPLMVMGLFKKIVVANTVKVIADFIFSMQEPTILLLLSGGLAFTLEILADFSAYTDLSRGIAYLLGFETSENFKSPYLALSPIEFWNRWHITLSFWLRDYIFYPLRRSLIKRKALPFVSLAVPPLLTMLASGFWHGVGWTYILWGAYYGILIIIYQGLGGNWKPKSIAGTLLSWLIMFSLIVFGWVLFRSPSVEWLGNVLLRASFITGKEDLIAAFVALVKTGMYAIPLILKLILDKYAGKIYWLQGLYLAAATILIIVHANTTTPNFIYVQF